MAFSDLLHHAGNFGRFQIIQSILTVLLNTLMITHMLVENFSGASPDHRCYVHLLDNAIFRANLTRNLTNEDLLRVTIPIGPDQKPAQCHRYIQTQWQLLDPNVSIINMTELATEPCLDGWIYDQSIFTSTIVTKWDLVCGSKTLKPLSQVLFIMGSMLGTPVSGFFADRVGRKPLLVSFSLICGLMGICSVIAPTFSVYCALRMIMALSLGTIFDNSLILLMEWSPTQSQPLIVTAVVMSLSLGQTLLGGLAYAFRDWQALQLSISVPYLVYFLFSWWFSESARWLIVKGKLGKSLKELKRVAHFNGRKDVEDNLNLEVLKSTMKEELATCHRPQIKELITSPIMCRILFCLFFLRFTSLFIFYGLMLDLKNVGNNVFLTQLLLGGIDLPIKYVSLFLIKYIDRRTVLVPVFFFTGMSFLVSIFIPQDMTNLRLGIAMVGKGTVAIYFNLSVIYSHELIPTGLRSTLQGMITLVSRFGATIGTLVLVTKNYFEPLPKILYGIVPLLACMCIYFLPETRNCPLPDTIKEVEKRDKHYRDLGTRKQQENVVLKSTEC